MIARMSKMTGKTLKDHKRTFVPESQSLLYRGNYFKEIAPGVSMHFSRGVKLIERLETFVEETLKRAGCGMISVPFRDVGASDFPGFMASALENEMNSYKDYPAGFYFNQVAERAEYKAGMGVFGSKYYPQIKFWRFFDSEETNAEKYDEFLAALGRELDRIGVDAGFASAQKDKYSPGSHGILWAENQKGDKSVLGCGSCGYSATEAVAVKQTPDAEACDDGMPEMVHTPQVKTIKDLSDFAGVPESRLSKAVVVSVSGRLLVLIMRGDRIFNPYKLAKILGIDVDEIKMANEEEIEVEIGSKAGFIGPVGLNAEIWADSEIPLSGSMICGANKRDFHLKNVLYGRDYEAERVEDLVYAKDGDRCPVCGKPLLMHKGFALGRFTNFGREFSEAAGMTFLNSNGKASSFSCHGGSIDLYSLAGMICHENRDELGICWPERISPYDIHVLVLNSKKQEQSALGEKVAEKLSSIGMHVILDDRPERAGFKFKDCELLGIPKIVVVGNNAAEGIVELRDRKAGSKTDIKYEDLVEMANH